MVSILRLTAVIVLLVTSAHPAPSANAQSVADIEDVNHMGSGFLEVSTGLVWLDYSNFYGIAASETRRALVGKGFRIASTAEVDRLLNAIGRPTDVVGTVFPMPSRTHIQAGFYDDSLTGTDPMLLGAGVLNSGFDQQSPQIIDDAINPDRRGSNGAWVVQQTAASCSRGAQALDFDCDGKDDKVVWRESLGMWFIRVSSNNDLIQQQWGLPGDIPIAGDYDGDGVPDLAVWRPSTGNWFIKTSQTLYSASEAITLQFGLPGDRPLRVDYDGDGRLDVSVWRPSNGTFYSVRSSDAQIVAEQFGLNGDVPVVGGTH